jgi:hypothetical protein
MKLAMRCFAVVVLLAVAIGHAAGPPTKSKINGAGERRVTDAVLFTTLREVINRGVDLYNAGDMAACYRVYEGSLMTVRPLLADKPDLQKAISTALGSAERDPLTWRRAFTLRNALDKVRAELNPKKKAKDDGTLPQPRLDDKKAGQTKPDEKKKSDDKQDDTPTEELPPPRIEKEQ